ncbi:MAG: hypothetical protein FJ279_21765, partial [Planctomycetes bacterium]|nr:hypothetical protein [Planctomycetota bacterium]
AARDVATNVVLDDPVRCLPWYPWWGGSTARFTVDAALANGEYAIVLDGTDGIADQSGNGLDGEFNGEMPSGDGTPGGDFLSTFTVAAIGPRVSYMYPGASETVPSADYIAIGFDEGVQWETVNDATLKVSSSAGDDGLWATADDTYVEGRVESWGWSANFYPTSGWLPNGEYAVWLDGGESGVKDFNGNALDGEFNGEMPSGDGAVGGDFLARFTVADPTGPRVTNVTPTPGGAAEDVLEVVVTFDEPLNPDTVNGDTIKVSSDRGLDGVWGTEDDTYVAGTVSYEPLSWGYYVDVAKPVDSAELANGMLADDSVAACPIFWWNGLGTARFTTNEPLPHGEYAVLVDGSAGITDRSGNALDGEFNPAAGGLPSGDGVPGGDFVSTFTVAALGPRVSYMYPWSGATLDSVEYVTVGFDEEVASGTVTEATLKVSSDAGADGIWATEDDTYVEGRVESYGWSANFYPSRTWLPNGEYAVWLDGGEAGVTDLDGNALDGEFNGEMPSGDGAIGGDFLARFTVSDPTAPRVTDVMPAPDAALEWATEVVVTFDEPLNPDTVNADTFKVSSDRGLDGVWGTDDDTYVEGVVSYDPWLWWDSLNWDTAGLREWTEPVNEPLGDGQEGLEGDPSGEGEENLGDGTEDLVAYPPDVLWWPTWSTARFTANAPFADGEYAVVLDGTSGIADRSGNDLDGEFTGELPSGDGAPGGDFVSTFSVHPAPLLPDLFSWFPFDEPFSPGILRPGDSLDVLWFVSNNSLLGIPELDYVPQPFGPAQGPWDEAVFLSSDPIWDADDVLLGAVAFDGALEPGQEADFSETFTVPADLAPGRYYVIAYSDYLANEPAGRIAEADEDNNWHVAPDPLDVLSTEPAPEIDGELPRHRSSPGVSDDVHEIHFWPGLPGVSATARTLVIRNEGNADLSISVPTVSIPENPFPILSLPDDADGDGAAVLAPGETYRIVIGYQPLWGDYGLLQITSDDGDENPYEVELFGTPALWVTDIEPIRDVTLDGITRIVATFNDRLVGDTLDSSSFRLSSDAGDDGFWGT